MTAPALVGPSPQGGGPAPSEWQPAQGAPLTPRQIDVLQRIADGQPWARIGNDLGISIGGVGSINKQILKKLGAASSAHAVFLACRTGVLDPTRRHGDHAGFAAHRYRREEPCEACWEGERAYRRERREARKASQGNAA